LSNDVSPVEALVSEDGQFVVTLDNWGSIGYGDDVLAIYCQFGQIAEYSLEEIVGDVANRQGTDSLFQLIDHSVSSRHWRNHSLMFIDGVGDSASFGIWLDWVGQWFVFRLSQGSRVNANGDTLKRWNAKGQGWAREQLQLPPIGGKPSTKIMREWTEEAQAWSQRKSARYQSKITACRFLARLRDPDDRPVLEHALASSEVNVNWEMELRTTADRGLAIHDGIAHDFRTSNPDDSRSYYRLGAIELRIRLPERTASEGQVYVSIFPETVSLDNWRTAHAEHRTGASLRSSSAQIEDRALKLTVRPVSPGKYWAKAVWDTKGPYDYDLYHYEGMEEWVALSKTAPAANEGDFETKGMSVFEVRTGETTSVTLDCRSSGASN
jgi:hypothetical protein